MKRFLSTMNVFMCILTFLCLHMAVDAQVTISADKSLPRDGETVSLTCKIPSFTVPASWIANTTGLSLTLCLPSGPCQPPDDAARYTYSATASTIVVTITSFNSSKDTFGWKCQHGASSVYVIKPVVPVTSVQLTSTSDVTLSSTLNIVRGGITYIRCSTAPLGSRPPATFHWYIRTVNQSPVLIGNQSISSTPGSVMVPGQPASDLVISYSTLTMTGDTMYQNMFIFCEARDEMSTGNYIQSGEVQLNIVYPPLVQLSPNYSVYNVTEGTQNFIFTCNITEANPLPQSNGYTWFHNSVVIQGQVSFAYIIPSVQKSDDGEYKCTAMNEYGSRTSQSLALNVQYPPLIQGLTSPYKVIENHPLNVTCQVISNPISDRISWSPSGEGSVPSMLYFSSVSRNKSGTYNCTAQNTMTPTVGGQEIGRNTTKIDVDVHYPPSIQDLTSPYKVIENQPLNVTCQASSNPIPDRISWSPSGEGSVPSILYFSSVSRNMSGNYMCTAQNIMEPTAGFKQTGTDKNQIEVDVLYPPSIKGLTSPYKVIVDQPLNVTCQVNSNPPPDQIYWTPRGNGPVPSILYFSSVSRNSSGTYNCTAQNTMTPTVGVNQSGTHTSQIQVDVLYSPLMQHLTSPYKVIEHQPLNVTCQVSSNPPPDKVSWSPSGEGSVLSMLYFSSVSRNQSGTYSCTAQNTMTPTVGVKQTGTNTSQIQVDVLYPPSIQGLTSPYKVIENQPLNLSCQASSNPLPDQIYWTPSGEGPVPSILYFSSVSRTKSGTYSCKAQNTMIPTKGVNQSGMDTSQIQVDVLYPPSIQGLTSPYKVIEHQPLNVTCQVSSNPPPDKVSWSPSGEGSASSMLYFSSVSRNKSGTYSCTAQNAMTPTVGINQTGTSTSQIQLDVLYTAKITEFVSKDNITEIMENGTLQLYCHVDSNPYSDISLTFGDVLVSVTRDSSELIYSATAGCLDAGKYMCSANNSIMNGVAVSEEINLRVQCHPRLDFRKNISVEYYRALNDNITLEVNIIAYPEPTDIMWYHRTAETDRWERIVNQSFSSTGLHSNISVHLGSQRDFGDYLVNMSNIVGIYEFTFHIIPESVPGIPTDFSITDINYDSITLEWTPGFWGGYAQSFTIEYRLYPHETWINTDLIKLDTNTEKQSFTVKGLQQKTTYEFRLYARNKIGRGNGTQIINSTTSEALPRPPELQIGPIAGGVASAVIVACIILVIIFIRRRNVGHKKGTPLELHGSSQEVTKHISGLVDNPVYGMSGSRCDPSASKGTTVAEYATVTKSKKNAALVEDPSKLYAQVDKENKKVKKGPAKGKPQKTSRGDVYQNFDLVVKSTNDDSTYENSRKGVCDENVYENPGTITSNNSLVNKDGLLYADLMFGNPTEKNGNVVIRGMENRTDYAEIAYGKSGELILDN